MELPNQASTSSVMYEEDTELHHQEGLWTLQPEKSIEWCDNPAANGKALSSKKLCELSAIDFSRPSTINKSDYRKREKHNQELNDSQTVTLFDLNQNHEAKVLASNLTIDCDSTVGINEVSVTRSPTEDSCDQIQSHEAGNNLSIPCVVCGDKSSGKHYGQITCEGCKSFFKRSVRRNLSYTCRGSKDCAIDPQHRNQCQYCRLRKCFKAGMRKEAVQRGRVNPLPQIEYSYQIPTLLPSVDPNRIGTCYANNFLASLVRAEPYPMQSLTASVGSQLDGLSELTARLFYASIDWAKNLPFFVDLPLNDQINLLRSCWAELFILNTAQCCQPIYISSILASANVATSEASHFGNASSHNIEVLRQLQDQLDKMSILRIDSAEFSCLKALTLFSPDVLGLQDPLTIQSIQDKALYSLDEYNRVQYGNQHGRAGRLLLRLPALKAISSVGIQNLFFVHLVGKTPVDNLIRDLLISSNSFGWNNDHQNNLVNSTHSGMRHTLQP